MTGSDKIDLLSRVASVLERLRSVKSNAPALAFELNIIEAELDRLEHNVGDQIDDYMARKIMKVVYERRGKMRRNERNDEMAFSRGDGVDYRQRPGAR